MSAPNMRRACPTQSYGLTTMPGSRRTSCIDPSDLPELMDDRYRQLEAARQQEIQRGVGLCAHLNRHGCGLGVSRSQYGLCSACSFFCTHSEHDPRTANTDTTNMTYEEIAQLELALARRVMFCEAEEPPRGPGLAEAVAVTAAIAEQAERQAAAHARLEEEYRNKQMANQEQETETSEQKVWENTEQANRDEEMQDAPEAGPSRGPAPQRGPSQRGHVNKTARQGRSSTANPQQSQAQHRQQRERVPRSEAEMMLDPEIMAYLTAVSRMPPQPHPLPPAIIAAQARAQHEAMMQRNMAAEQARQQAKMEQQRQQQQQERNRQRAQQRDQKQYEAQLAKNRQRQLQKQQEEDAREEESQADLTEEERAERRKKRREEREEQARQQLLRLQEAGREHVLHQQEKLQQERVKRQQQILQRQQQENQENQERREEKGKGKEREQPQLQQTQVLPMRQPLPVATRGD